MYVSVLVIQVLKTSVYVFLSFVTGGELGSVQRQQSWDDI